MLAEVQPCLFLALCLASSSAAAHAGRAVVPRRLTQVREALASGDAAQAMVLASLLPADGPQSDEALHLRAWALWLDHRDAELEALLEGFDQLDDELTFVRGAALLRHRAAPDALQGLWWRAPDGRFALAALRTLADSPHSPYGPVEREAVAQALPPVQARPPDGREQLAGRLERLAARAPQGSLLAVEVQYAQAARALRRRAFASAAGQLRRLLGEAMPQALREAIVLSLGEAQRRRGDYGAALACFDRVAESMSPLAQWAQAQAGAMFIEMQNFSAARTRLLALLHQAPVGPRRADALWGLGWVAFRTGDFRQARNFLRTLATEQPYGPRAAGALYFDARARQELGDHEGARRRLQLLVARFPADYYTYRARAQPRLVLGEAPEFPATRPAAGVVQVAALMGANLTEQAREALQLEVRERGHALGPDDLSSLAMAARDLGLFSLAAHVGRTRCLRFYDFSATCRRTTVPAVLGPHAATLVAAATAHELDAPLLLAVARAESNFDERAVSSAGAVGVMQLMPATAADLWREDHGRPLRRRTLLDPEVNTRLGARYLARLMRAFDNTPEYALASYNAGGATVLRWRTAQGELPIDVFVEEIPYAETRTYVKRVLAFRELGRLVR